MPHPIERVVAHRPWPLPDGPWILFQSWRELLFAHWPVRLQALRPLVPPELVLEEFDDNAWVGVIPFRVVGLRPRFFPPLPGLSTFAEMNLRTYVRVGDRPGVFFFSLDAASRLAVLAARVGYGLPYFRAEMQVESDREGVRYRSRRKKADAEFVGRYRATGRLFHAEPGTLDHFLIERYALYTVPRSGTILRADIHHRPWPLQRAEAEIERNTVPAAHGIPLPGGPPLLHYAARQDTLVWPPKLAS